MRCSLLWRASLPLFRLSRSLLGYVLEGPARQVRQPVAHRILRQRLLEQLDPDPQGLDVPVFGHWRGFLLSKAVVSSINA